MSGLLTHSLFITVYAGNVQQEPVFTAQREIAGTAKQTSLTGSGSVVPNIRSSYVMGMATVATDNVSAAPVIALNPNAAGFVKTYLRKNKEYLQKMEKRSVYYFKTIETIFRKHGLPEELKYMAIVESDLNVTAVSRVGAVGAWQLMPQTARELGLKVSKKGDERKNLNKSTEAVALYLKDLYRTYNDWLLVMAAYNVGPGNVNKAMRKAGSRNFWEIQKFLPAETRGHVKRFIGLHYYFEDRGSITTLTKAEKEAHIKAVARYKAKQEDEKDAENDDELTIEATVPEKEINIKTEKTEMIKSEKEK